MSKLAADVLEACLLGLPEGTTRGKVRPHEVVARLKMSSPAYETLSVGAVKDVLKMVFPIYKNRRGRTNTFKITHWAARRFIANKGLLIRDLADAREARIGHAVDMHLQALRICPPASPRRRVLWESGLQRAKWRRVLVHVEDRYGTIVRVTVPQWNTECAVHIPLSAFPDHLMPKVERGLWLLAMAQIASDRPADLRIKQLEAAPEPDEDDGLS